MSHSGSMLKTIALAVLALAVTAGSAAALFGFGRCEKVKAADGTVAIPQAKVGDGRAHYFAFEDGGKTITFFLVKAADGSVRSAFDACDVCYHEKKGYEQQGDAMICRNCNRKFAVNRIGPHAVGGCNPSFLPHREAGGRVLISVEDLKAGARYF